MKQKFQRSGKLIQTYLLATILGYSAIIIGGTILFIALAQQVHQHKEIWFDTVILTFFAEHRTVLLDDFFIGITWAGSSILLFPISISMVGLLIRRRYYPEAILMGVGFSGASLLNPTLKALMIRDRPLLFTPLGEYAGFAFPSGHTAQITAFALSIFIIIHRIRPCWQWSTAILLIMLVVCVATSRVYLQVHYPSDVLGGLLVALIWVFSTDALIRISTHLRMLRKTGEQP